MAMATDPQNKLSKLRLEDDKMQACTKPYEHLKTKTHSEPAKETDLQLLWRPTHETTPETQKSL
jgi:hypothetical protein